MPYTYNKENDMGLDNIWKKNKEENGVIEGDFKLCGGVFSGHGNDSFRGKVYDRFVEDVTGVSLYGDPETFEIPNETVKQMADDLEAVEWRDSYIANYDIEKQEFKTEYQNLPWKKDEKLLQAWINGQTGYPIIDAAMRQLKATGQMPNRLRMIVASFLCKDLLLDWRFGQAHFANYLLDFDLASNNGGWQWAASTGVDAVPYFRIFNPTLQSEKFDPKAKYIKTYIPELNNIEAKDIHNMTFLIPDYPAPIVNHKEAKQKAIEFFKMHLKPNASEIRLA